jgi:type I restriction enzyme R subunit
VKGDDEAYIQSLEEEPKRKEFYDALNSFLKNFNECMVLQDFVHEFKNLDTYRGELKKFMELRKTASVRYADRVDFDKYKQALIKIMDDNIKADEAELLTKQITITDREAFDKVVEEMGSDKSKAEAIAAQTQKTITEQLEADPVFYQKFSDKINEILDKMRKKKLADIEALKQMKLITEEVLNKKDDTIPAKLQNKKGADIFFRNLEEDFTKYKLSDEQYVEIIASVFDVLRKEVIVDWHRNSEVKRIIFNKLDDYLYDEVVTGQGVKLSSDDIKNIIDRVVRLATENYQLF